MATSPLDQTEEEKKRQLAEQSPLTVIPPVTVTPPTVVQQKLNAIDPPPIDMSKVVGMQSPMPDDPSVPKQSPLMPTQPNPMAQVTSAIGRNLDTIGQNISDAYNQADRAVGSFFTGTTPSVASTKLALLPQATIPTTQPAIQDNLYGQQAMPEQGGVGGMFAPKPAAPLAPTPSPNQATYGGISPPTNKSWTVSNSPVGSFTGINSGGKYLISDQDYPQEAKALADFDNAETRRRANAHAAFQPHGYSSEQQLAQRDALLAAIAKKHDEKRRELEAQGIPVWGIDDSNALIGSQLVAKNQPENLAYDLAMRNRHRADNGKAPIESPFDKQAIGTDTKDWLGIAKYRQEDQQFAANQEMEQRKGMLAGVSAAGVSDPTAARAAFDKNLSVEQVGKVLEVVAQGDPKKSAEAYKAMQKANAKAAEAEAKAKADEERNNLEANSQRQVLNARNRSRKRQLYMRNMLGPLV